MHHHHFHHYNHAAIDEVKESMRQRHRVARRSRARVREEVEELEEEVLFLNLVNRTLVSLLVEKGVCTNDELAARLAELDAKDGSVDGGSTGDELAKDLGFDELPVERPAKPLEPPKSSRRRRR